MKDIQYTTQEKIINEQMDDETFLEQIVIPAYWGGATQDIMFGINDLNEKLILTSNLYAKSIGFNDFQEALNTYPGIDYPRVIGTPEQFAAQKDFLVNKKCIFDYIYKRKDNDNTLYLSTAEPIFNYKGEVIAKKEFDRPIRIMSHRDIIENHFKRFGTNVASLTNLIEVEKLNDKEELILFMLIAGYSQQEIAEFLKFSRSYVVKIINDSLCPKFGISTLSTKILIDKAVSLGYALFIPDNFLNFINNNINLLSM